MPKSAKRNRPPARRRRPDAAHARSDAKILRAIDDLSPAGRRAAIRRLLPSTEWLAGVIAENRPRIEAVARARGLDWVALSDEQREQLVDDILHDS